MHRKLLTVLAATLFLAACSSDPEESGQADAGGAATQPAAQPQAEAAPMPAPENPPPPTLEEFVGTDRVYFDYDQSDLTPNARATLDQVATFLSTRQVITLTIEGHCDERGTREYNLALGERRANAIRDYLIALGINQGRLATISYGKERPAVLGSSESIWAQNRRGVFVVN